MKIDFDKLGGLVPAIVQDAETKNVLMLGFMNPEAYEKTVATGHVTFWSRTRQCLWTKGETSGHFLHLVSIQNDCDNDTLLVKVHPEGPTAIRERTLAGEKPTRLTGWLSSKNCKTLSTSVTKKCLKAVIPPACLRKESTK